MPYQTNTLSLGYTGELTDPNGLVYLRARAYAPRLGAFLTRDPVEGVMARVASRNGYGYVEGNPVNWTDPSGECGCPTGYGPSPDGKSCVSLTNSAAQPLACPGAPDPILTNPPKLSFPYGLATGQTGRNIAISNLWISVVGCLQYQLAAVWSHVERLPIGRTVGGVVAIPKWGQRILEGIRGLAGLDSILKRLQFSQTSTEEISRDPEKISQEAIDRLLEDAMPVPRRSGDESKRYRKTGGLSAANEDFDELPLSDVTDISVGRVGKLPNGINVVIRGVSTEGQPTIEVQWTQNNMKVRYDP